MYEKVEKLLEEYDEAFKCVEKKAAISAIVLDPSYQDLTADEKAVFALLAAKRLVR